ncbi:MAG: nucleoside triphosphate pyrophosphohydrolase [Bacillota bacterium]|nr:nucleoside triphosphate pyrophosphohydrolase [Bacillota bacterium]
MKRTMYDLLDIIRRLRAPGGCPWDREQNHDTLKENLIEEAYEAYDAISEGDDAKTMDELGDVLLQVVFHALIAEEEGKYNFEDITENVCEKMVRRHPHVFGEICLDKSSEVLVKWEMIKSEEKGFTTYSQTLSDVVRSLPALKRAQKLQKRASRAGFDWDNPVDVFDKLEEEKDELKEAVKEGTNIEEEIGDLLFTVVNLSRKLGIDAELALDAANSKFIKRFSKMEEKSNGDFALLPMDEKDKLWKEAKDTQ